METIRGLNKNGPAIIGTGVVFTVLATASVFLRVVSKYLKATPFGWDDWTSFLALAIYIVAEGLVIQSDVVGRRADGPENPDFITYIYYVYIYSIFYFCVTALCLVSVLCLYRRLFVRQSVQRITFWMLLIMLGWIIEALIIEIFADKLPVAIPHDPTQTSWHIDYLSFWFANGIIEEVITLAAILIPIFQISRLHLTAKKQALLTFVFAISALCFITGILRLALLYRPRQNSIDLTLGDILLNVHLGTAIMSANLPVCWPIVSRRKKLKSIVTRRTPLSQQKTDNTLIMHNRPANRRLSSARLTEELTSVSFDPRGVSTWSEAKRVGSNDSEAAELDHAATLHAGNGIAVTQTVDVRESA